MHGNKLIKWPKPKLITNVNPANNMQINNCRMFSPHLYESIRVGALYKNKRYRLIIPKYMIIDGTDLKFLCFRRRVNQFTKNI